MGLGNKIKGALQGDKDNREYRAPEISKTPGSYPSSDEVYRIYTRERRRENTNATNTPSSNPPEPSTKKTPQKELPEYTFDATTQPKPGRENVANTSANRDNATVGNTGTIQDRVDKGIKFPYWGDAGQSTGPQKPETKNSFHDCAQCQYRRASGDNGHAPGHGTDLDVTTRGTHTSHDKHERDSDNEPKTGVFGVVTGKKLDTGLDHVRKAGTDMLHGAGLRSSNKKVETDVDYDLTSGAVGAGTGTKLRGATKKLDNGLVEGRKGLSGITSVPHTLTHRHHDSDTTLKIPEYDGSSYEFDGPSKHVAGINSGVTAAGVGIGTAVGYGASELASHHRDHEVPDYKARNPEYKGHNPSYKTHSPEYKAHSPEYKAHSPEYKAYSPEYKTNIPEYHVSDGGRSTRRHVTYGIQGGETYGTATGAIETYDDYLFLTGGTPKARHDAEKRKETKVRYAMPSLLDRHGNDRQVSGTSSATERDQDELSKKMGSTVRPSGSNALDPVTKRAHNADVSDKHGKDVATSRSAGTSMLDPIRRRLGRESGRAADAKKERRSSDSESDYRDTAKPVMSGMGSDHYGPGHAGAKVLHRCEHCEWDNDISRYFRKEVVYRMS